MRDGENKGLRGNVDIEMYRYLIIAVWELEIECSRIILDDKCIDVYTLCVIYPSRA